MLALVVAGGAVAEEHVACAPVSRLAELDEEQSRNVRVILATGQSLGVPSHGLTIALATAYQESRLRNLPYGDRDSLGLFQQRPSAGWGTAEQVQDPLYAARAFFGGATGPNSTGAGSDPVGLLDIDGWQTMALTAAADAVQRSAAPNAYARWEDDSRAWLAALLAADPGMCATGGRLMCPPTGLTAEAHLSPGALRVLRCIHEKFPTLSTFVGVGDRPNESDHPAGRAVDAMIPEWATSAGHDLGWQVAEWVRANATWGVTYVIFDAAIWSMAADMAGWRPFTHPAAAPTPTRFTSTTCTSRSTAPVVLAPTVAGRGRCEARARLPPGLVRRRVVGNGPHRYRPSRTGGPRGDGRLGRGGDLRVVGGPYGQKVEITHPDGTRSWYAHLSAITTTVRAQVTVGEVIGRLGWTGNATGPHLHFEIRPAPHRTPVDPEWWMAARDTPL